MFCSSLVTTVCCILTLSVVVDTHATKKNNPLKNSNSFTQYTEREGRRNCQPPKKLTNSTLRSSGSKEDFRKKKKAEKNINDDIRNGKQEHYQHYYQ